MPNPSIYPPNPHFPPPLPPRVNDSALGYYPPNPPQYYQQPNPYNYGYSPTVSMPHPSYQPYPNQNIGYDPYA